MDLFEEAAQLRDSERKEDRIMPSQQPKDSAANRVDLQQTLDADQVKTAEMMMNMAPPDSQMF